MELFRLDPEMAVMVWLGARESRNDGRQMRESELLALADPSRLVRLAFGGLEVSVGWDESNSNLICRGVGAVAIG